jgi:hypothetical protein
MKNLVIAGLLVTAMLSLGFAGSGPGAVGERAGTAGQKDQLPPVPKDAEEAYFRALDIIEMLNKQPNQAAGSAEWDVVIKRLMEAQREAPKAPQILRDLGLAHQLRGRASAAAAWFKAAYHAIKSINANAPLLGEIAKRIERLREVPADQIELALTFAVKEIPYIHAMNYPNFEVEGDIFPPTAVPPAGPLYVQLADGQWTRNPALFNKDGSPKPREVSQTMLKRGFFEFRLAIGDISAVAEAEEYFRTEEESSDVLSWSWVRLSAYKLCLKALTDAESWPQVARLAGEAAEWCRQVRTAWTDGQEAQFNESKQLATEIMRNIREDKTTQWVDLATELAGSDDEVYFQAKIDRLRQMTERGDAFLEGIAVAIKPVARNLMRLRSIAD